MKYHLRYQSFNADAQLSFGARRYNLDDNLITFIGVYDNNYLSIIAIYFYETFSTLTQNI
jgi:hypothetical protein